MRCPRRFHMFDVFFIVFLKRSSCTASTVIKPAMKYGAKAIWLVVWTPLKNISQLGWLFPIYGKIKNVPNHQPAIVPGGVWNRSFRMQSTDNTKHRRTWTPLEDQTKASNRKIAFQNLQPFPWELWAYIQKSKHVATCCMHLAHLVACPKISCNFDG